MSVLLLTLLGCFEPTESGPNGLVGRLRDAAGLPLRGVEISSLEATDRTDDDGHFAVQFKPPEQVVIFRQGVMWWKRPYTPADDGLVIDLHLPRARDAALRCPALADCALTLTWRHRGLEGWTILDCAPGRELPLAGIPEGAPEAACRDGAPLRVRDAGAVLHVSQPPKPIRIRVAGDPPPCLVFVGGSPALAQPDGEFVGLLDGSASVAATCGGRPAVSKIASEGTGAVTLEWSADGPELDPGARTAARALRFTGADGASFVAERQDDGRFLLPPLTAGEWLVTDADAPGLGEAPTPVDDRLVLPRDGGIGALRLTKDRLSGRIDLALR